MPLMHDRREQTPIRLHWILLLLATPALSCVFTTSAPADPAKTKPILVPTSQLSATYVLVGKLGVPLGEVVKVAGVVVEGPFKGYEGGPNLRIQRINGKTTPADIQIKLVPYFGKFDGERSNELDLPKLKMGKTYEFEGYETGGIVGIPRKAFDRAGVILQTCSDYFATYFVVIKGRQVEPIRFAPADFVGQFALLEGRAKSVNGRSFIVDDKWRLLVDPSAPWPADMEGKQVEAFGVVRVTADRNEFSMHSPITRLVRLEDQLGRKVQLRGQAWSMNGTWWFNYRGTDLYVENMEKLPGWSAERHGDFVQISGTLDQAIMPAIHAVSEETDPAPSKHFIVRNASWQPIDNVLSPERAIKDED